MGKGIMLHPYNGVLCTITSHGLKLFYLHTTFPTNMYSILFVEKPSTQMP